MSKVAYFNSLSFQQRTLFLDIIHKFGIYPFFMRSKEMFVHRDTKIIRQLMKEIGKERFEAALLDAELTGELKPKRMQDFFLEWEDGDTYLSHKYPMGKKRRLMDVIGFQSLPFLGWERIRVNMDY